MFVSEALELPFVIAPVLVYFDVQLQENLLAEELFYVLAGLLSDFFEFLALVSDQDALLGVACDIDDRRNAVDRRFLPVGFDRYFATVGDLLVVVAQDLFADYFRGEESQRFVRERIFGVEGFSLGQPFQNQVEKSLDIEILACRYRDDRGGRQQRLPFIDELFELFGRREVDLVDYREGGNIALADLFEDVVRTVALLHRVGDVEDYVRIVHGAGDEFHHRLLEFVAGFQNARRIREDDLEIFAADHSQNAVARGLGFGGDDREAFAYECVHQRRFADVGISDDIDETGLVHRMSVV